MAVQTTSTLSGEVATYYESKFLERAKYELLHGEGAQKNTHPKGKGKTIQWNRYAPLPPATTPLTEGNNPSEVNISSTQVTATLQEYGTSIKISKLLKLTSIDEDATEKIQLLGQNMGETIDTLDREALFAGATVQLANGRSSLSAITASDVLTVNEVKKAVRTLKMNKAIRYPDGYFIGKIGPATEFDLTGDTIWVNAATYSDVKKLYRGEVGSLHNVRFINVTNQKSESSTVTVYSNFIHGDYAFAKYDLAGDVPKLYIKTPNEHDTSNTADRYSVITWAGSYVSKVLVSEWVINVKTAASA
jgi:N4-gp56 family major capsid protein